MRQERTCRVTIFAKLSWKVAKAFRLGTSYHVRYEEHNYRLL